MWVTAFRTSGRTVNLFGIASLALLVSAVVFFERIAPERLSQRSETPTIVEGLLAANVAAYVFFFITYQLPRVSDIERTGPRVALHAGRIASNIMAFLQMAAYKAEGVTVDHNSVTEETARRIFATTNPNDDAPQRESATGPCVSWLRAMALQEQWCQDEITELWHLERFLESELVAIVSAIELSHHAAGMKDVRKYGDMALSNTDLMAWLPNYWECYEYARELERYVDRFCVTYGLDGARGLAIH